MIKKLTLTRVYRSTQNKQGQPYLSKDGRPYTKVGLKTQEYGEKWLSGFGNNFNSNWREGDVVEVEIEQKGEFLNFKGLTPEARFEARIAELEKKVAALSSAPKAKQENEDDDGYGDGNIDISEIPF